MDILLHNNTHEGCSSMEATGFNLILGEHSGLNFILEVPETDTVRILVYADIDL